MFHKRSSKRIFAIALLILCSGTFAFAQNSELSNYEKSIDQGNFAEVERDVLNYAIRNPKEAKVFELLGKIRFDQNRLNEAKSLFNRALVLDPKLITSKIKLAETYYRTDEIDLAKNLISEISDDEIANDEVRLQLGEIYALTGNCKTALLISNKLATKIKNTKALPLQADCFIKTNDRSKLKNLITLVKLLDKNEIETVLEFSEIISNDSMQTDAIDILQNLLSKSPANEKILLLLAKAEILSKDFTSAKKHISQIEKLYTNSFELLFVKGLLEAEQGNDLEAIEFFEQYLAIDPTSIEGLKRFTISAMRSKQAGKAIRSSEKLLQLKPNEAEFLYLLGAASLQAGKLEEAENSLKSFLKIKPIDPQGCLALGLTYAAQPDKLDLAREQMSKCIEINPNNYEAKYQLGLSYKTQGETVKAITFLEQVVEQKNDYANVLRDLGSLYLQNSQEQKARTVLEKAVSLNPKDADTHFQLSRLYNLIGEQDLAKKHLKIFQDLRNPKTNGM